jgi:hypothetical protein
MLLFAKEHMATYQQAINGLPERVKIHKGGVGVGSNTQAILLEAVRVGASLAVILDDNLTHVLSAN